jgi:hypothetical protein
MGSTGYSWRSSCSRSRPSGRGSGIDFICMRLYERRTGRRGLVSTSKGGNSPLELQRQLGFASYQTAWTWLHKLRRAMILPHREPLGDQIEADETYVGGSELGKRGRGLAARRWSPARWSGAAARGVAAG